MNEQQTLNHDFTEYTPSTVSTKHHLHRFSCCSGFWVIATVFLISTGFTVVTTPLWPIYQQREELSAFMITLAFASYPAGVLVSLFLGGHVSDWVGRRIMLLPAVLIEALAAVLFIVWNDLPGLLVARFITGLGLGLITATATAHISELHSEAHPDRSSARPDIIATAANIGGFAVGVIVSSALVQLVPAPTTTPFVVFLVLLLLAALGISRVPETVAAPAERRRYRPQRVQIPDTARGRYFAAAAIAFAGFAVLGLFTSLTPSFVSDVLHFEAPLAGGTVVFVAFLSAAALQIFVRRFSLSTSVLVGVLLYVGGFAAIITGTVIASLSLFVVGGILAGGAAGVLFSTAASAASQIAAPGSRGEALAGIFLSGYAGLAIPVIALGAITLVVSMSTALTIFAVLVTTIAVIGAILFTKPPVHE